MKIYRFSDDGFAPQRQNHHYDFLVRFLEDDAFFAQQLAACQGNKHIERILREQRQKEQEFFAGGAISDIEYGAWVFSSKHFRRRSLNHLNIIPQMWEADIDDAALAYSVDLDLRGRIADIPGADSVGCFLPARELARITGVRKIPHPYHRRTYEDFYKRR